MPKTGKQAAEGLRPDLRTGPKPWWLGLLVTWQTSGWVGWRGADVTHVFMSAFDSTGSSCGKRLIAAGMSAHS